MTDQPYAENTQRIANVNTHRIDFTNNAPGMDRRDAMATRLREARGKAGYPSAASAAEAFGWNAVTYTSHENGTRGYDVDSAVRYGKAFKINPGYLLGLDAIDAPAITSGKAPPTKMVRVVGAVEAGVWRERSEWSPEDQFEAEIGLPLVPNAERFGVVVEGFSMDKVFPPGSVLECLRVYRGRLDPQEGDLVVVERRRHDLVETTCKRLTRTGAGWTLIAESTKPEFGEPIELGEPDADHFGDDAVEVIGIVARAVQTHYAHRRRG